MATIKAIEGRSVHQIQSGQVIVDLVSVVKELVENSLDAGASSIDIRFKGHGLDSIEVQDNGNGIAPADFESLALKHYTSKLASFEDLDSLETFGFRGEALSSLTAVAVLQITTARAQDGPVGKKLDFKPSGQLKSTSVVAAQKGTTVLVQNLFHSLPVRRKALEKNIKREYNKALGFLQSYACIGVGIRLSVSNQPSKGKKMTAFSTKGNQTMKENIANVFGAKTLTALVKLDLTLNMQPGLGPTTQSASISTSQPADKVRTVQIEGYISKPGWGEGRQTPDRQMFFVRSRPCQLPQVTKVFNDVYKSYNHHQSPFILANLIMDTNTFDVNVSPDKKTIMLHDQTALLEALRIQLANLFENIDHSIPQSQMPARSLPAFKPLAAPRRGSTASSGGESGESAGSLVTDWAARETMPRPKPRQNSKQSTTDRGDPPAQVVQSLVTAAVAEDGSLDLHEEFDKPARVSEHGSTSNPAQASMVTAETEAAPDQLAPEMLDVSPSADAPESISEPSTNGRDTAVIAPHLPEPNAFEQLQQAPEHAISHAARNGGSVEEDGVQPKRRKLNVIRRGSPETPNTIQSTAMSDLTQFAAPGSQLLLSFDRRRTERPEVSQPLPEEAHDEEADFAHGDSTPEMLSVVTPSRTEDVTMGAEQSTSPNVSLKHASGPSIGGSNDVDPGFDLENAAELEQQKKQQEDARVAALVKGAEQSILPPSTSRGILGTQAPAMRRDATYNLAASCRLTLDDLKAQMRLTRRSNNVPSQQSPDVEPATTDAESRLSLTVSKADFARMRVVGQFNLGFILALRPRSEQGSADELFIVDQHAADEKYNYERLQSTVVLQSQRLVKPIDLELSAVEQEVVLNHRDALAANGFEIEIIDHADDDMAVQQFRLLTLPMTNHKTFQLSDLEELLHLLSEVPSGSKEIPRPRKVQRMLAMRACRSSIMVGKTLTNSQMTKVVHHMGGMDKPWNCPHGRPTMRHLYKLDRWHNWDEYNDIDDDNDVYDEAYKYNNELELWKKWLGEATE